GFHVADGGGDLLWLQMAHLLTRAKTDRPCPGWSRSRLSLSLAGDGRGEISTHVHRQDTHAPPYTSKHSRRNYENFSRGRSLVWAFPLRFSYSLYLFYYGVVGRF